MNEKKIMSMIFEDIECLKYDLDSLIDFYKEQAKKLLDESKFNEPKVVIDRCNDLVRFKQKIDEMTDELDSIIVEEKDVNAEDNFEENDDEFEEIRNFAFTNPLQIKLFNKIYDVKGNWRDVLIMVCEELIRRQPDKVKEFDRNEIFRGRTRVYFSYDPAQLTRQHRKLSNGLYVELNMDNNDIVKRCRDAVEQCGYNPEDIMFKVEWKKELQQTGNKDKTLEIENINDEIKLSRQYGSVHITKELFTTIIEEILNYQDKNKTNYINPVKIKEELNEVIITKSTYSISYHVVTNIFKYLLDCKLIDNFPNTKRGKYIIKDEKLLKNWVESINK